MNAHILRGRHKNNVGRKQKPPRNPNDKIFMCELCSKGFSNKTALSMHINTHEGVKPFQCDACDKAYANRSNLDQHIKSVHIAEKKYRCDQCVMGFTTKQYLKRHIKTVHTTERPFPCGVCDQSFKYKGKGVYFSQNQGCIKFLIPHSWGGEFIKSFGEEFQVVKRGR